jgi:hypothetical protein
MDTPKLIALVTLILAMSIATERFVEIIKGYIPSLDKPILDNEAAEGRRKAFLQILAVIGGCFTAWLTKDHLPQEIKSPAGDFWGSLGLGLLASGGSGFWNSILTYLTKVKDVKSAEADVKKTEAIAFVKKNRDALTQ